MSDLPQQRPTDETRERVIDKLTLNYAHNHLNDTEFEDRLSRATSAESNADLLALVDDLPDIADQTPDRTGTSAAENGVAVNRGLVKDEGAMVAIMSGTVRRGVWQPPRHLRIFAMMGGVELDFTQAEMPPGTTEVTVFTVMGGVDITVPPGLNCDVSGVPLMGGFDDKSAGMVDPNAPTLKVRGVAIMGGVDVKMPRKFRKYLRDLRRSRHRGRLPRSDPQD